VSHFDTSIVTGILTKRQTAPRKALEPFAIGSTNVFRSRWWSEKLLALCGL